jgi:HEAT repeat protein
VSGALIGAILALAGIFALLLAAIVVARLRADRQRRREARLRPGIEGDIALFLADLDAGEPEPPASTEGRVLFRDVAIETLIELTGRERERLASLLERAGIVEVTALELSARRRLTRLHAAEFLAEMRSRSAGEALLIALLDPDPDVRLASARALAELGDDEFVEPLIAVADEDAEERPGAAAAVLLAIGVNNPDGLEAAVLERRTAALRRLGTAVIAERRLAQFAPQLRAMLPSADDELVARAARGLGAIGDADSVDELVSLLDDEERPGFCRVVAANALGGIGDPQAVPALTAALERGDWLLRDRAAAALAMLGEPGHEVLRRVGTSGESDARVHAKVALDA